MLLAFPFVVRCGRIKLLLKRWRAAYGDLLLVGVSGTGSRSGRSRGWRREAVRAAELTQSSQGRRRAQPAPKTEPRLDPDLRDTSM